MKKARWFMFALVLVLVIASPVNTFAVKKEQSTQTQTFTLSKDEREKIKSHNAFEIVISSFLLTVGDYAHDYLTQLFRQEITIDGIVFNQVTLLNANFFVNSANPSGSDASTIVRTVINKWYETFRTITLLVCVVALVAAGIKIMLGTPEGKNAAQDIIKKIVMAVMLVYFFPFVMKLGFDINEAIITMVQNGAISGSTINKSYALKQVSELKIDEDLEFRSPIYVSNASLKLNAGSDDATEYFVSKLQNYQKNTDIMRLMRAYAGVTLRFMYVVIWYLLLVQTYFMVYTYLKRYVTIAFLLCIYPLTVIGYVIGGIMGRSKTSFNEWCSRFFGNVFKFREHLYNTKNRIILK